MDKSGLIKGKEHGVWIETYTGKQVDPLHMRVEDIDIQDIAKPLSHICRYVGQCKRFYSVGQHSIHVAELVEGAMIEKEGWNKEVIDKTCLAALLHDAPEAYTNDISRPVKYSLKEFVEIEKRLMGVITERFNLQGADWQLIKKMDNAMMATEAYQLMKSKGKGWWLPEPRLEYGIPEMSFEEVTYQFIERFCRSGGK